MPSVPHPPADGFRYLPRLPDDDLWGIAVSGAGQVRTSRATPYPPRGHPADHSFNWETGRVLNGFQIVFISDGAGRFESRRGGTHEIAAGDALLVFPSVWHRYEPLPATGWFERWVELDGPAVRRLLGAGLFDQTRPVLRIHDPKEFSAQMDRLIGFVRSAAPGARAQAGAIGHVLLAALVAQPGIGNQLPPGAGMVAAAERLLADGLNHPLPMPALAKELGVGYSYFRREFLARTGLSPKRYQQRMRLERARRLLGSTRESLDMIAERVGFCSAFHLSAAFKKEFGVPPKIWRQQSRTVRVR
jgi:AraC-like DNA-binding protein